MLTIEKNHIPWIALAAALLVSASSSQAQNTTTPGKTTKSTPLKTTPSKTTPSKTVVLPSGAQVAKPVSVKPLTEQQKIVHALNRLAFGPRPGDVERVRAMGLQNWIDEQLRPETIDDSAVEAQLRSLSTLRMTPQQLAHAYEADQLFRRQMALMRRQQVPQSTETKTPSQMEAPGAISQTAPATTPRLRRTQMQRANGQVNGQLPPQQQRRLEEAQSMGLERGVSTQVVGELVNAKLVRAVESNRQLHEVLVDFWANHFNLDVKKGPVRTYRALDERDVIREHVWDNFRDLLGASAKSPAMLFYLDNVRSTKTSEMPNGAMWNRATRRNLRNQNRRQQMNPANATPTATVVQPRQRGGLNENYARELMELHTLGVNGGYTQKDVQEVARCFTGWGVNRQTGEFRFNRFQHDDGEKTVLGQKIPAGGGIQDGERVLDILANHPSTAKFIARKLCMRLVNDEPPSSLVQRTANTFTQSRGDLRTVVESIVKAPEFWTTPNYRAKVKSPFEFAVSSVRALGGTILLADASEPAGKIQLVADGAASANPNNNSGMVRRAGKTLAREIATMGQPLYSFQAPTGYPEKSQSWVSAGALVSRLNFALSLTNGQLVNVSASTRNLTKGSEDNNRDAVLDNLAHTLLGGEMSASTRSTLLAQTLADTPVDIKKLAALILGSPEFQRR